MIIELSRRLPCHCTHGPLTPLPHVPLPSLPRRTAQYKTVLDAIRARKEKFLFDEVEVVLKHTVMAFITMVRRERSVRGLRIECAPSPPTERAGIVSSIFPHHD